jgi:hypothetical protein
MDAVGSLDRPRRSPRRAPPRPLRWRPRRPQTVPVRQLRRVPTVLEYLAMTTQLHGMPDLSGETAPTEAPKRTGLDGLPRAIEQHLRAEFAATREPGWLERYQAEVEARRQHGPRIAPRR